MNFSRYLLPAALLSAGMSGVESKMDPGNPHSSNAYDDADPNKILIRASTLPQNLLDALRALEKDSVMSEGLGLECTTALIKLRKEQWLDFTRHLTEWELKNTLDC
mmetsp:Transcript_32321/g.52381  ORF Transcript_32321/g.52381 Transcript_32321/m.52381 type:complete len:106 (+) Transcript_32321:141-458(+)